MVEAGIETYAANDPVETLLDGRAMRLALEVAFAVMNMQACRKTYAVKHDGFTGTEIGAYTTREGKEGVVLQQVGTRVVHVYGRKWLVPTPPQEPRP